ncbi:MAG: type IV pilus twitching motility protein PilT [Megamonas funiformis]|uniref:type IV pilus twitching motility protein PilT n=1 Tax=Megamonas TaxID=158846 RepID=UPI00241DE0C4|nr:MULTISPECIES: ATPase, T2SS/T4P/T4SS family [Megamonas]MBS5780760.1 Flp pilus assembly complex ATPase component TadA [Megamonas sp.]
MNCITDVKDKITKLIIKAYQNKASDLFIRENMYPYIRNNLGKIEMLEDDFIKDSQMISFLKKAEQLSDFLSSLDFVITDSDFFVSVANINCRCHFYKTIKGRAIAIRLLPDKIPSLNKLGLPESVKLLADKKSGLIIVSGPTGSGKSTTIASIIDVINQKYNYHIITIEDPIEYTFENKKSIISQIPLGKNITNFSESIKSAMRENPNVIMIGELRTLEDIKVALFAAESGHLVITTLHANNAIDALDRMINYEEKLNLKNLLANTFQAIITQKLVTTKEHKVLCLEILLRNNATVSCIKNEDYTSLINIMKSTPGMMTMQDHFNMLKEQGIISKEINL